jgi:hypothetical protein
MSHWTSEEMLSLIEEWAIWVGQPSLIIALLGIRSAITKFARPVAPTKALILGFIAGGRGEMIYPKADGPTVIHGRD